MNHENRKKTTESRRGQEREGGSGKRKYCENATIILAALPANLKDPEARKRVHQ